MSAVDSPMRPLVIPERQRQESPVVIDVDALDTDDIVYIGSARSSHRRPVEEDGETVTVTSEVIDVTDSEDDEIQFVRHNPAPPLVPPVGRARIFSPPPPPQIDAIPSVPQVPQRFLRQHPPAGLIIPNENPFPFEADLRPPSAEQLLPPPAAAPSHHVPTMGFGGALLAGVRRIMAPRNAPQRPERHNSWGVSGSFIMRWDPFDFMPEEDALFDDGLDGMGFLGEDHSLAVGRVRSQIERAFKQRGRGDRAEPDYLPAYTHPNQPPPGFTHDFSPVPSSPSTAEGDVPVTQKASSSGIRLCEATLICAACQGPLVLGASDVGEDRAKRKLWSLRCGHLLDGKCIEKLMEPTPPTSDVAGSSSTSQTVLESEYPRPASQGTVSGSDAGSMRSRLRPRRGLPGSVTPVRPSVPASLSNGSNGRHGGQARTQTIHRGSRKGKGKMKMLVIDAEHEWSCPVSGCGRVHVSLLMDGRWTMDEKRGATAVFA